MNLPLPHCLKMAKKSGRPKAKAKKRTAGAAAAKLSNKDKSTFLEPYLNRLLALKSEQAKNNKKNLPKDAIPNVVNEIKRHGVQWVNETLLKKKLSRMYKKHEEEQQKDSTAVAVNLICPPPPGTTESATTTITSPPSTSTKKKAGRTPIKHKMHYQNCISEACNEICDLYYAEYSKNEGKKKRCGNKLYIQIFNQVKKNRNLPDDFSFSYKAVMSRIYRKTIDSPNHNKLSPLHKVEPTFVEFIACVADTGVPLSVGECILFINSTIRSTTYQKSLIEFKKKHYPKEYLDTKTDDELGQIGRSYWRGFMTQNKHVLGSTREKKFELQRSNCTKYRFFCCMFEDIERVMVEAGVAKYFETPQWMNEDGDVVDSEMEACGFKCKAKLIEPSCVIVLDEAGGDTAMTQDGHPGGRKMVGRKGDHSRRRVTKKARRYTVVPLLALTGEAVMCVVIIDGSERNSFLESGVDVFAISEDHFLDDFGLSDYVDNYGYGNVFPGGPVCTFRGKKVPCMVRMKKGGGIDENILLDIFKTLDILGVYDDVRARGINPVVILDGHQSRFKLSFLEYVTNDEHRWHICIGVRLI